MLTIFFIYLRRIKVMNKKYYISTLAFFTFTLGFAGPGGGPPPPTPPPPPGFPLDQELVYLLIFGLIFAFLKLKQKNFQK